MIGSNTASSQIYKTHWKRDRIEARNRAEVLDQFGEGSTKEDVMEELIRLRTAINPIYTVLSKLIDDDRNTVVSSGLFPQTFDHPDATFLVYKDGDFIPVKPDLCELHDVGYVETESFTIDKGSALHDLFSVLRVDQSSSVVDMYGGTIYVGDIRYLSHVFRPKK